MRIELRTAGYASVWQVERVGAQSLDAGEDIEVHLIPLEELIGMAKRGEFPHALQAAVLFRALVYLDRIQ